MPPELSDKTRPPQHAVHESSGDHWAAQSSCDAYQGTPIACVNKQTESRSEDFSKLLRDLRLPDTNDLLRDLGLWSSGQAREQKALTEAPKETTDSTPHSDDLKSARDQLLASGLQAGLDSNRLSQLMQGCERRCAEDAAAGKQVPTEAQLAKAYANLNQLIAPIESAQALPQDLRNQLCLDTLQNLACPTGIKQEPMTCNVTTIEEYAAMRAPDRYTDLIKQVALTGSYQGFDGKLSIAIPDAARHPESASSQDEAPSVAPNYASRVFQDTAVNLNPHIAGKFAGDMDGKSQQEVGMQFSKSMKEIQQCAQQILGRDVPAVTINPPVTSEQIEEWKRNGDFPIILMKRGHVQTIHDVRKGPDGNLELLLDNQFNDNDPKNPYPSWKSIADIRKNQYDGQDVTETAAEMVFSKDNRRVQSINKESGVRCLYDAQGKPAEFRGPGGSDTKSIDGGNEWITIDGQSGTISKHRGRIDTVSGAPSLVPAEELPVTATDRKAMEDKDHHSTSGR